jgi:hypothetical protein
MSLSAMKSHGRKAKEVDRVIEEEQLWSEFLLRACQDHGEVVRHRHEVEFRNIFDAQVLRSCEIVFRVEVSRHEGTDDRSANLFNSICLK